MGVFVQTNCDGIHRNSKPVGYVIQENGCWDWIGYRNKNGYGWATLRGKIYTSAHRVLWERLRGPIPKGMVLDHLCRNRACVNPDHCEVVTPQVNTMRGFGPCARHARKTHCPQGHEYSESNTIRGINPNGNTRRRCRICDAACQKRKNAKYGSKYTKKYQAKLKRLGVARLSQLPIEQS